MRNARATGILATLLLLGCLVSAWPVRAAEVDKVNLNTANAEELAKVPGITPELAKAIVEYRAGSGAFKTPEDLLKVPGMNPELLRTIAPQVDAKGDVVCPTGNNNQEEEPSLTPSKC
jgi:competence ComEA-like helix-hairpin-helix protein